MARGKALSDVEGASNSHFTMSMVRRPCREKQSAIQRIAGAGWALSMIFIVQSLEFFFFGLAQWFG